MVVWDPNKAIDKGRWSIWGGGRLEGFYCINIMDIICDCSVSGLFALVIPDLVTQSIERRLPVQKIRSFIPGSS